MKFFQIMSCNNRGEDNGIRNVNVDRIIDFFEVEKEPGASLSGDYSARIKRQVDCTKVRIDAGHKIDEFTTLEPEGSLIQRLNSGEYIYETAPDENPHASLADEMDGMQPTN